MVGKEKIMANAELEVKADFKKTYEALKARFKDVTCSMKLGVIKIKWKGKTIMVFRTGKISIREADSEDDAVRTFHTVSKAIKQD
jgi:TATA-box binding protein (TBP) (component of TFIID and TFIIIB)